MIKNFIQSYRNLEKTTYKIMKNGLLFCFFVCLLSLFFLIYYLIFLSSPILFYIGISLFRLSLVFGVEFIICGIVVDNIKKQKI